jgi:hypothetical protein
MRQKPWQPESPVFNVSCPLGDHDAAFDCKALTLDCATCGYALSPGAAAALVRLSDRAATLEAVVAEHLAGLEPSRRLAAILEAA